MTECDVMVIIFFKERFFDFLVFPLLPVYGGFKLSVMLLLLRLLLSTEVLSLFLSANVGQNVNHSVESGGQNC